jgi:zinc-binding alcohol dehydrogenase/oxidoreductase
MNTNMKAIIYHELVDGTSDAMLGMKPKPSLKEGEVLVKINAGGLNRRDVSILQHSQHFGDNIIMGSDGCGSVVAVYDESLKHLIGQEVVLYPQLLHSEYDANREVDDGTLGVPVDGTLAEFIAVDHRAVIPKPAHLTAEQAAALPLAGLTAYRALVSRAMLQKGENILIRGIGSSVSEMAIVIARAVGANVYVSTSNENRLELAKEKLGVKGGVLHNEDGWEKKIDQNSSTI